MIRYACLAALAAAVYTTSLWVPFLTGDDEIYVTASSRTRAPGLDGFLNVWTLEDVWRDRVVEHFPLRDAVYWAIWQGFGDRPAPYHAASIAAHAAAVLLLFALAQRLGFSRPVAFWGAALFATHPIHVESVTWISGLKDPMFTALVLACLLFYARYRESRRPLEYALSLAAMVAALLVKSIPLVTPLLMVAIERFVEPRTPWRLIAARVAGPLVISAIFFTQFLLVGRSVGVIMGPHGQSWALHWFLAGWALVRYVQQALVPATFSIRYCFAPPSGWLDWRIPLIALTLVAAVALFAVARRRAPRAALLWVWFFAFLLPVMNVVPFPAVMADRYLYASTAATCLLIAWVAQRLPGRSPAVALGAAVLVMGAVTLARGVVWQDEGNLWAEAATNPECSQDVEPHGSLVLLQAAQYEADPERKIAAYEHGFSTPSFAQWVRPMQCRLLSNAVRDAVSAGKKEWALGLAGRAIQGCAAFPGAWDALAAAAAGLKPAVAADAARQAYRLDPTADRLWRLGLARLAGGEPDGARQAAEAVLKDPETLCSVFSQWLERYRPDPGPHIDQARERCASTAPDGNRQGG